MDSQNARLKAARIAAGYTTAREAWEKFNWNPNTYRALEAGPREIGKLAAIEYAAALAVPLMWLLTGLQDAATDDATQQLGTAATNSLTLTGRNIGLRLVPVVSTAAYGEMASSIHRLAELATGFVAIADEGVTGNAFAFRVVDKAMEGAAPQALIVGDVVIVDRDAPLEPGRVVLAGLPGGQCALRIYGEAPNPAGGPPLAVLTPVNQHFAAATYARDALAFLFRVVVVQHHL